MSGSNAFVEKLTEGQWRLGNKSFTMRVSRDASGVPLATGWMNNAQPELDWASGAPIGPVLVVGNATCTPGSREMTCTDVAIDPKAPSLCLSFTSGSGLVAKHYLKPSPDKAVLITWTTLHNPTVVPIAGISRFDALNLMLRASAEHPWAAYLLGWLYGPRAEAPGRPAQPFAYPQSVTRLVHEDDAPAAPSGGWASSALRLIKEPLAVLPLRSGKRSTYDNYPWCTVLDKRRGGGCFAGLEWSGTWELNLGYTLEASTVSIQAASAGDLHSLEPGGSLASPLAFVGLFAGDWDDGFNACRRYTRDEILPPVARTFPPVQDNVGNPGLNNTVERILGEIEHAHKAGVELITIDAQWYQESSETEFSFGLGGYTVDKVKFPNGLRAVSDRVHALGMKFGLWFEFSRVDLRTANRGRIPWSPTMLVHYDKYAYRSWGPHLYMLCTGAEGAAEWALENMASCVREFNLDYIKIDDNDWGVCNDATHGHAAGDGEWAQIQGVYHILRGLRERFPHLVIENCASGSQRADPGMARFCVPIQMNDRHWPAILERRYSHGVGCIYPQFVPLLILGPQLEDPEQLRWRVFSRMMGNFTYGYYDRLPPALYEEMKRCAATYKRLRPTLHGDRYVLAEPAVVLEPDVPEATNWEVYEYLSPEADLISVFCFRCNSPDDTFHAVLKGLDPRARYRMESHTQGELEILSGAQLMREGIACRLDNRRRAQLYILNRI